jgi:recombination protein RecT
MMQTRPELAAPREVSTSVAERPVRPADQVRAALERMKPQIELALPRHLTADRLLRVAMTAVQNTPKLLDCDRTSLYSAIMTCAQLGLEPDGILGQAYLVPFAGRVTFIPGYKGLISLARNSGDVTSIAAHEVRDEDVFKFDFASGEPPSHTFDIRKPRGDVIAFYAIARFTDGSFYWDLMTLEEVNRIRDGSSGYQYAVSSARRKNTTPEGPWIDHYVEMGKKTVIRRIAKYLPLSVQKAAALADAYDSGKHAKIDTHGDLVIDGTAEHVDADEDEAQQGQPSQPQGEGQPAEQKRRGRPPKNAQQPPAQEVQADQQQASGDPSSAPAETAPTGTASNGDASEGDQQLGQAQPTQSRQQSPVAPSRGSLLEFDS